MSGRPFVVCYICGREFGSASIGIHEEQCLKKWHQQNNARPKNERLPPPVKPQVIGAGGGGSSSSTAGGSSDPITMKSAFNEAAAMAASGNLYPCPSCKRTFNADRLEVHKRICKPFNQNRLHPIANNSNNNSATRASYDFANFPDPCLELKAEKREVKKPGPVFVICYICGRQFGTKSLAIHEPQCIAKWEAENQRLPKELRRPKPVKTNSDSSQLEAYNEDAWKSAQQQLIPCPNCSRRFASDRLDVHLKSCSKQSKGNEVSRTKPSRHISKPRTVVCYICGREYGTASISIHEPQCLEKWDRENEKLPPHLRQKRPEKPKALPGQAGSKKLAEYNEIATEHSNSALIPCSKCGRTFNPDRVMIHERICKGK